MQIEDAKHVLHENGMSSFRRISQQPLMRSDGCKVGGLKPSCILVCCIYLRESRTSPNTFHKVAGPYVQSHDALTKQGLTEKLRGCMNRSYHGAPEVGP